MKFCSTIVVCLILVLMGQANATIYKMPSRPGDRVVALVPEETLTITSDHDQTLLDIARRFNLGQTEIVTINPDLDRWLIKTGDAVRLPNRRILPDGPHDGITLNIAEYRMYYYPASAPGTVRSYAHGVGRQDWQTPLGKTSVAKKVKDPAWHPPESIRREHAANGDFLPEVVPPGIHNPLGAYALYLNLRGDYRIHGTDIDKIFGIGMQITHGCVRMYPEDIDITRRMHAQFCTLFFPDATIVHDHAQESYKSKKMLWIHLFNLIKYFNKWGWFFDVERKKVNAYTLELVRVNHNAD